MKDTVIFDLDGTLLDTLKDLHASVNYAMDKMGYPMRTIDEVRAFVGNGVKRLIDSAVPGGTPQKDRDKALEIYLEYYFKNMGVLTVPYDGIVEMLGEVKRAGYKTAVVSNKYDLATKELCRSVFPGLIDFSVGERTGIPAKPAPDGVFEAIEFLKSARENSVYVGDSEVDVATAKNAGLPVVGVSWGFRGRRALSDCGADIIIDEPCELLGALKKL